MIDDTLPKVVWVGRQLDSNPDNTAISTYHGNTFDLMAPDTWEFHIHDIARSLSSTCRFAGHVDFYSVAEHSVRVSNLLGQWGCSAAVQLLGLLHDASEAYLLDIPRPWKRVVSIGDRSYFEVEDAIQERIFEQFGVIDVYRNGGWTHVKKADHETYMVEAAARPAPSNRPMAPKAMYNEFMWHFEMLSSLPSRPEADAAQPVLVSA
jgi:hypothetical protein